MNDNNVIYYKHYELKYCPILKSYKYDEDKILYLTVVESIKYPNESIHKKWIGSITVSYSEGKYSYFTYSEFGETPIIALDKCFNKLKTFIINLNKKLS